MHSNQNLIDPLAGASTDALQPVIGSFLNQKAMQHTDEEIWRDIPDWKDYYQISSHGKVKSLERYIRHKFGKNGFKLIKEKILKINTDEKGYLQITFHRKGKIKTFKIHVLVAMAFKGYNPDGTYKKVIDHIDYNPLNNHVSNLQITSHRKNTSKDKWRKNISSQYTGVSWSKNTSKWISRIYINGKIIHLGLFTNEIKASEAYQDALKNHLANGTRK